MAKEQKRDEKKKVKKLNKGKVVFTLVFIALIVVFGIYIYDSIFSKINKPVKKVTITDEIKEFGYVLEDNETDLYKDYFKQLAKTLNGKDEEDIDYDKYAELISKLFVADFYNLDNKITKNDVGGLQFIHEDMQENFLLKAKDTMYKNIESDVYNDRKQELPVVNEIELDDITTSKFDYKDSSYDSYEVTLSWNYKKDLGYDKEKTFTLIKSDKKLWLVESTGTTNNETNDKTED